jgi:RecJ-like exonuclease
LPESQTCPGCGGKGRRRDREGEYEECPVCRGEGTVEGFLCLDPEADYIRDEEERER